MIIKKILKAFISYQSTELIIASEIKGILSAFGIQSFLAHDDIRVSEEWQPKIIDELKNSTFVICLLSEKYIQSAYCLQETGIALILNKPIISLSLDNTTSPGFIAKYQSKKITEKTLSIYDIIPGLVKVNKKISIEIILEIIKNSSTYKGAEQKFELIMELLPDLTKSQANKLMDIILNNNQIMGAGKCRNDYLPKFIQQCSTRLPKEKITELQKYIKPFRRKK